MKITLKLKKHKVPDIILADLLFWRNNHFKLPIFSIVARKILAIPATSAAVERFFSKTGFIMRPHRRRLGDTISEQLFYLKANWELLN